MNIQQLRQSLKMKWLSYYQQNRTWLIKMRIWATYEGLRRPSSGFILATLSVLEPQFDQILVFIMDLNNNPDRIVASLGLNFNPDEELNLTCLEDSTAANEIPDDSPLEAELEDNFVTSVAVTEVATESPSKAVYDSHLGQGFARREKVVSSATVNARKTSDRQPVASIAEDNSVTSVATESPSKAVYHFQPGQGFARREKVVSSAIVNARKTSDRQPVASVAVTTQINRASPPQTLLFDKPHSVVLRAQKPVRWSLRELPLAQPLVRAASSTGEEKASPLEQFPSGGSLAILNDVPRPPKTLPSLIASQVSRNGKTLSSLTVAIKIPSDGKPGKIQLQDCADKVKPSPSSNARSLASWVDEFCQGSEWNPEEAIFIQF
jgi:hypothetical protein